MKYILMNKLKVRCVRAEINLLELFKEVDVN